jgi:hypothetical protein
MKTIEVEWYVTPKSGLTQVTLDDLDCKSIEEWNLLSVEEQKKSLEIILPEYDLSTVQFHVTSFYEVEDD